MSAGQAAFRQGDPADRFYVIEKGMADVIGDGHLVTTLGPGEGFGQIALMRGCGVRPRFARLLILSCRR